MRAARFATLATVAVFAAACAANPPPQSARVDYRGETPDVQPRPAPAKTAPAKPAPTKPAPAKPAPTKTGQPKSSGSPAVAEAAGLRPEITARPGGPMKQVRSDLAARALVVKPGDSLAQISERYSVNIRALIETNGLAEPYIIKPGATLYLPAPNIHVVQPGETLFTVGQTFNIDTRSLALMNGLARPWTVWPGDELLLPPLARDQTLVAAEPAPVASTVAALVGPVAAPLARIAINAPGQIAFIWPVTGPILSAFGANRDGVRNDGVNIAAPPGADVKAAAAGEVVFAGDELAGFRNLVLVKHDGGYVTAYANADALLARVGDKVAQGQPLARTGLGQQPDIHFELRKDKQPVDPETLVGQ